MARTLAQGALLVLCLIGLGWLAIPRATPAAGEPLRPSRPAPAATPVVPSAAPEPTPEPPPRAWPETAPVELPAILQGRVEAGGQPLAGVTLILEQPRGHLHDRIALSQADGRFELAAAGGHLPAWLLAEHPDWPPLRRELVERELHGLLTVRLDRDAVVQGRVVCLGRPVPDARVYLVSAPPEGGELPAPLAVSDLSGQFRGEAVAAGEALLLVRHPRHPEHRQTIFPRDGRVLALDIALQPGCSLAGSVTRAGQPVADVLLSTQGRETHSDAHGSFRLEGLRPGALTLVARSLNELHPCGFELPEAGLFGVSVELPAGLRHGSLRDAHGTPLADADLYLSNNGRQGQARSDADGRFELSALPAGAYLLEVRTARCRRSRLVQIPESLSSELAWQLPPLAELRVLVQSRGQPLVGAQVDIQRQLTADASDAPRLTQFSDAAGALCFRQLEPGSYRLQASAEGLVSRTLQVELPGTVSLELPDGIALELALPAPFESEQDVGISGTAGHFSAFADETGYAQLVVPPGHYTLEGVPLGTTLRWAQQQAVWEGRPLHISQDPTQEDRP